MPEKRRPETNEVELILENATLRDALEPYLDESVSLVNARVMPTSVENEFLASMLAWEQAPILPISRWFEPELVLPRPETLADEQLHQLLWETIHRLYKQRVVLDFTDHLSDRELYCVIFRDILPSPEKKVDLPKNYLHWHCIDDSDDADLWLRFYATPEQRREWAEASGQTPPPSEPAPYPRRMPRRPHNA